MVAVSPSLSLSPVYGKSPRVTSFTTHLLPSPNSTFTSSFSACLSPFGSRWIRGRRRRRRFPFRTRQANFNIRSQDGHLRCTSEKREREKRRSGSTVHKKTTTTLRMRRKKMDLFPVSHIMLSPPDNPVKIPGF